MFEFNAWSNVDKLNLEKVIDLVITNGTSQSIQSDDWLLPIIANKNIENTILDFGCGVGRNILSFSQKMPKWQMYGYDNPNMLQKMQEYTNIRFNKSLIYFNNVRVSFDWDFLKTKRFDCIYAVLVFQHIYEKDLNIYLQDIKKMTNRLVVKGRRFNDERSDNNYKNTLQILENNGFYPSNVREINYNVDGDPKEELTCVYNIF